MATRSLSTRSFRSQQSAAAVIFGHGARSTASFYYVNIFNEPGAANSITVFAADTSHHFRFYTLAARILYQITRVCVLHLKMFMGVFPAQRS